MDVTADTASALISTTAATHTCSVLTFAADTLTLTAIAATTMAAILIMDTLPHIITVPDITDGLTIRGPRRLPMDGAGVERHGMATTVLTSLRIRYIHRPLFG